jgi:hypothetical protein
LHEQASELFVAHSGQQNCNRAAVCRHDRLGILFIWNWYSPRQSYLWAATPWPCQRGTCIGRLTVLRRRQPARAYAAAVLCIRAGDSPQHRLPSA